MTVKAIDLAYTSNADLMLACRELGYLSDNIAILDPTYGLGVFWGSWRPKGLWKSDLTPKCLGVNLADFTALPWVDDSFDAVVFDPPYKLNGTPTEGVDDRYGVGEPTPVAERLTLIRDGITECARVVKPGGHLLLKCQDQVVSGHVVWQTFDFKVHAEQCGLALADLLLYVGGREQPAGRRQLHARRNYSSLLVFKKRRQR